ncbi:hypothetical protein HH212_22870 [Massilia forsythiae]|uniref:Uncharacterized protein n=1 Tax=Massilia forsythiae TaxID=2728020 RepID=A0A7Z2W146_9BURK|nr:hypothetical protein [Massilia forsythiae]QJE02510.1 hypothetical protein HH212_22870 [Massilia forsythiae]
MAGRKQRSEAGDVFDERDEDCGSRFGQGWPIPARSDDMRRMSGQERSRVGSDKLAAILARLKTLWATQARGRRVSRLDGGTIFTDAEWAALGDCSLFAKLGEDDEGGGAPTQASPPSLAFEGRAAGDRSNDSARGQQ